MAASSFPLKMRAGVLGCFVEAAKSQGIDATEILSRSGIDPATLNDVNAWIPANAIAALLNDSAVLSGRDDFGVLLARCQGVAPLGPIALLLAHESTVMQMVRSAIEFLPLISNALVLNFSEEHGTSTLKYELLAHPISSQLADLTVCLGIRVLQNATGGRWRPATVHFRHRVPNSIESFRSFFRCPLFFNSDFDGWTCPSADLDVETGAADGNLVELARRLLAIEDGQQYLTVSDRVRNMIYNTIATTRPTLAGIARSLGMSARSLQRKLEREGETFEAVLKRVRREISGRSIALSNIPITEIAYLTGFHELSAFSRWFREEFDSSPAKWRAAHRTAGAPKDF
jgi:AraC-like DNA-binding protein